MTTVAVKKKRHNTNSIRNERDDTTTNSTAIINNFLLMNWTNFLKDKLPKLTQEEKDNLKSLISLETEFVVKTSKQIKVQAKMASVVNYSEDLRKK